MKECPLCTEEIRDDAVVCEDCSRDQWGDPGPPPPSGGGFRISGSLAFVMALGVVAILCVWMAGVSDERTRAPGSPSGKGSQAKGTSGAYGKYKYTIGSDSRSGTLVTVFMFTPLLPPGDAVFLSVTNHILEGHFGTRIASARMLEPGRGLHAVTGAGTYDVIPLREESTGEVVALMVTQPR